MQPQYRYRNFSQTYMCLHVGGAVGVAVQENGRNRRVATGPGKNAYSVVMHDHLTSLDTNPMSVLT